MSILYPFLTTIPPPWNLRPTTYLKPYHILLKLMQTTTQQRRGGGLSILDKLPLHFHAAFLTSGRYRGSSRRGGLGHSSARSGSVNRRSCSQDGGGHHPLRARLGRGHGITKGGRGRSSREKFQQQQSSFPSSRQLAICNAECAPPAVPQFLYVRNARACAPSRAGHTPALQLTLFNPVS